MLTFVIRWRAQTLGSEKDIRDHYAKEVERFQDAILKMEKHYRDMLNHSDEKHEECQKDRDSLREELYLVKVELRGVREQISRYSADALLIMEGKRRPGEPPLPEHSLAAAKRVKEHGAK